MTHFDLTPLFRTGIGFDHIADMLNQINLDAPSYPPYNIERYDDNHYAIVMAVAGFSEQNLDIVSEGNMVTISTKLDDEDADDLSRTYLHQGIAKRAFTRKFNLAEHVKVVDANLSNGLLTIELERELPEAMKPRNIAIATDGKKAKTIKAS